MWKRVGQERTPPSQWGLPHSDCHDLHDGLIEALAEADQGGPAVTHAAQHDACGAGTHELPQIAQAEAKACVMPTHANTCWWQGRDRPLCTHRYHPWLTSQQPPCFPSFSMALTPGPEQ